MGQLSGLETGQLQGRLVPGYRFMRAAPLFRLFRLSQGLKVKPSKELATTTFVHRIFGGRLRSQVCLGGWRGGMGGRVGGCLAGWLA